MRSRMMSIGEKAGLANIHFPVCAPDAAALYLRSMGMLPLQISDLESPFLVIDGGAGTVVSYSRILQWL